jgi:hypothetical protein
VWKATSTGQGQFDSYKKLKNLFFTIHENIKTVCINVKILNIVEVSQPQQKRRKIELPMIWQSHNGLQYAKAMKSVCQRDTCTPVFKQ